ncbi:MAG: protoporphyrinogen oxidase [Actinomycetota bacterium]
MNGSDRVAVVGAGVAGLATAYRLAEAGVDVEVVEASERGGGKLAGVPVGDLRLPAGADSFVARKPWAVELCRELGLGGELTKPGATGAYLWTDRGLVAFPSDAPFGIPGDIADVFRWPGLSKAGRRRAAQDLLRGKRKDGAEETLGGLLRRRLGDEATDLAVAPLLAGLHAGDVDRLSASATFPELVAWESSQGSLIRGSQAAMRASRRVEAGPMFLRPRGGVERLTDALAARLGDRVRTDAPVGSLEELTEHADAVVLAVPAFEAARLVRHASAATADELDGIPYASTAVVLMVYAEGTQSGLPAGTGFVVPRGKAPMTASTWLSSKWPEPAFGARAVVRCYLGSAGDEEVVGASDDDLVGACATYLAAVVDLPARPETSVVVRWLRSMPQYELGHVARVRRIRDGLPPGIFVVGAAYDGVGIPDCVRAAGETADLVAAHLGHATRDKETAR